MKLITLRTRSQEAHGYCCDSMSHEEALEKIRQEILLPLVSLREDADLIVEKPIDLTMQFYGKDLIKHGEKVLQLGLACLDKEKTYELPFNVTQLEELFWQVFKRTEWSIDRSLALRLIVHSGFSIESGEQNALEMAMNQENPSLLIELINLGSGRKASVKPLIEFILNHSNLPGMKGAIAQLSKVNKRFGLLIACNYFLEAGKPHGGIALQGLDKNFYHFKAGFTESVAFFILALISLKKGLFKLNMVSGSKKITALRNFL